MLETMLRNNYLRSHNLVFVDDIIGWVSEEWFYKYGKKYLELEDKSKYKDLGA